MTEPVSMDVWFTMGSTYTYLTIMRLEDVAQAADLEVRWRPFNLRALRQSMGVGPAFPEGAAKTRYMWRDIARQAAQHGLPARIPAPYPIKDANAANCLARVGMREGWGKQFVRSSYERWFHFGEENGGEPNVRAALGACGQNYERVMDLASSAGVRHGLEVETDEARQRGLFGSPSFVVRDEIFWGNDRLEDAVNWFRAGRIGVRK